MRSTVGPLPPAVYWRRRAVVLGALLLVVIMLFVACGGGDDKPGGNGNGKGTAASQAPTPAPADPDESAEPDAEPSFSDAKPNNPDLPDPDQVQPSSPQPNPGANPSAGTVTGTDANVTAPANGQCADQEVTVTPQPASPAVRRGVAVLIRLKIKNISTRECTRDLGAGAQELYLVQGAKKYWSSDTCSADRTANLTRMQPGAEFEYTVTWNGRQTDKCQSALAAGSAPPPGHYELRGRLGTKLSEPVTLSISA